MKLRGDESLDVEARIKQAERLLFSGEGQRVKCALSRVSVMRHGATCGARYPGRESD